MGLVKLGLYRRAMRTIGEQIKWGAGYLASIAQTMRMVYGPFWISGNHSSGRADRAPLSAGGDLGLQSN
jgi:hypothetical protein